MDWKKNNINIAVQVLPEAEGKVNYSLVDVAIEAIRETGFQYKVCPFETVVECSYYDVPVLIDKIHDACRRAGTERMLTNIKLQVDFNHEVSIDDKMKKYS